MTRERADEDDAAFASARSNPQQLFTKNNLVEWNLNFWHSRHTCVKVLQILTLSELNLNLYIEFSIWKTHSFQWVKKMCAYLTESLAWAMEYLCRQVLSFTVKSCTKSATNSQTRKRSEVMMWMIIPPQPLPNIAPPPLAAIVLRNLTTMPQTEFPREGLKQEKHRFSKY